MMAQKHKSPGVTRGSCGTARGGAIVDVRPPTGHIIQILPAQSIVAVKAHVSIRADQSQNASKVDRKIPGNADPCAPVPWRSSDCAAADTEKGRFGVWGITEYLNPAKVGTW